MQNECNQNRYVRKEVSVCPLILEAASKTPTRKKNITLADIFSAPGATFNLILIQFY